MDLRGTKENHMYNIAKLALSDRKALFDTYSFRFGAVREIVEKDF